MRSAGAILVFATILAAGCGPTRGPEAAGPLPPCSPAETIAAHNAWADSVQHIWSRAAIMLNLPNPEKRGERQQYDMDGHLFLQKPECLYVHGAVIGQEVFKMGMNAERFWLWVGPKVNTVWHGKRGGEGERRFILAAADVMTALGVGPINLAPGDLATFLIQPQHCVLTQERVIAGERVPMRRIWFDRRTLRPVRIDVYDEDGRCILMSELMKYERAGQTDVCTLYRVRLYGDEEVDLVMRLSAVSLEKKPNPKVFEFVMPEDARKIDLDATADKEVAE